ncbi:MAG: hypothetical protein R3231_09895 [bacterium]|nr:hypothetical protein [bacterium]
MHCGTRVKACLILFGLLVVSTPVDAEPITDAILDDITITEESEYTILQVGFALPMRYVKHFPYPWGEELRIQLSPLSTGPVDDEGIYKREAVHNLSNHSTPLVEIVYEGQSIGGPYITIRFDRPMEYLVGQGTDFRSLVVVFFKPEASRGGLTSTGPESAAVKP